ncbi:MAG: type VI secretion system-associated protein TagF [Azoarcus sp.]|jgi:type VI secretion system protein ImpM|nr:type VI secretion system-associated protein TagF [Azoarcus sp.]
MKMLRFFKRPSYVGWFGKLPSVGDFAGRGMPSVLKETVHGWMSSGMAALAHSRPNDWQAAYLVSPVWHFLIGSRIWDTPPLIGCLAPSVDKVGRCSPLIALRSFYKRDVYSELPPNSRWLYQVDMALRQAIGERMPIDGLHDLLLQLTKAEKGEQNSTASILCDLGIGNASAGEQKDWFAWPELPELFKERSRHSFWWSEPSPKLPLKQVVHSGVPDDSLFCSLMDSDAPNERCSE